MGKDGPMTDLAAPMTPEELTECGVFLYGSYGWMTKLAGALDKNPSTLRRWKSGGEGPGSEIPLAERRAIRALVAQRQAESAPPSRPSAADADHRRALLLLARAQKAAANGLAVGASVSDTPWGIVLTLVFDGKIATLSERDAFHGIVEAEAQVEAFERAAHPPETDA